MDAKADSHAVEISGAGGLSGLLVLGPIVALIAAAILPDVHPVRILLILVAALCAIVTLTLSGRRRARSEGRPASRFSASPKGQEAPQFDLVAELRESIARDELFLMYQPQVEIRTGRIIGVEALVRWMHPTRGLIGPGTFIPAAEKSGLIVALGHWVLREACLQTRRWLDAGIAPPVVAINLSAIQLKNGTELERQFAAVLAETRVPPHMLEVELTETALMETSRRDDDFLRHLRAMGVGVAIDDFGTGYSSLLYLRRFPADRIKIAQDFVLDLETNANDAVIVKATIGLAQDLGMKVMAEGVETPGQLRMLQDWGCGEAQGYLFAKPMLVKDLAPLLRRGFVSYRPTLATSRQDDRQMAVA